MGTVFPRARNPARAAFIAKLCDAAMPGLLP